MDIWKDNWIPRNYHWKPFTPNLLTVEDTSVAILRQEGENQWNEELVRAMFWDVDVSDIFPIPLTSPTADDCRIWHYSRNAIYTVRTTYYLWREIRRVELQNKQGSSSANATNVNWIWKLKIPNKIRVFIWRQLKNSFPTLDNLQKETLLLKFVLCATVGLSLCAIFLQTCLCSLFLGGFKLAEFCFSFRWPTGLGLALLSPGENHSSGL